MTKLFLQVIDRHAIIQTPHGVVGASRGKMPLESNGVGINSRRLHAESVVSAFQQPTYTTPHGKRMPQKMWMNPISTRPDPILMLHLLQPRPSCNAIKNLLDLPCRYVLLTIAREKPAFRSVYQILLQCIDHWWQENYCSGFLEFALADRMCR